MDDESTYPQKAFASPKELAMTALFTALVWFSSFTILAPMFFLLVVSSAARNKFFTLLVSFVGWAFHCTRIEHMRSFLFEQIRTECQGENNKKRLRFLEMGVGQGRNFKYYKASDRLTLLDMNPNFQSTVERELKNYPELKMDRFIVGKAEDMREVGDEEYDAVVATLLFCSVDDRAKVMQEARRVLKTGGKLAFMEHIGYPKDHLAYWIQRALSPIWSVYCNGCRLDRDWKEELNKVFSGVSYEVFYPVFMPMVLRPHAIVVATK